MNFKDKNLWALILGGSSGFGLATAKQLSSWGMNICVVHRDRKGAMSRIEPEFEEIKKSGVKFEAFNVDALSKEGRAGVLEQLSSTIGSGKIRLMLHSIAFGTLKLAAPQVFDKGESACAILANKLGVSVETMQKTVDELFVNGQSDLCSIASPAPYNNDSFIDDDEMAQTIYAMGTSMLSWTKDVLKSGLFAEDARVIGLTSEGNEKAWLGYAAVSAAKAALEAISRSIAKEFAPHGIRSNIVQPGVTDTPALRLIPGSPQLAANARMKNPFGRLTQVEDVARVVALLSTDEAAWINGSLIRVDGGERIAG
jgi:NAD(P)-dependent dehydrogenase (short-subunit alcohol dehydrogenase family)